MPDGIALANRIRVQIASHSFGVAPQQSLRVTVSIGVCGHPTQGAPASAWPLALELADRALYRAKSSGRNRAVGLSVLALPKGWTGLDTADIDVLLNSDAIRWHLSDH
jgi:diguanylate cyclase (GGDEF)-like protein